MAGIDHSVVAGDPEHAAFQVVHERRELFRICCPPRVARELAVGLQPEMEVVFDFKQGMR